MLLIVVCHVILCNELLCHVVKCRAFHVAITIS